MDSLRHLDDLYGVQVSMAALAHLVHIHVWHPTWCFEFAAFKNRELAMAINAVRGGGSPVTAKDVDEARRRPMTGVALNALLNRAPKVHKAKLALELWPRLEHRLRAAQRSGAYDQHPMSALLLEVVEQARAVINDRTAIEVES